ncbi:hypothetical protein F9282_11210 [Proteus terrae subsp. cibarius]|uniref:Phage protein n=1 Tax=Proteus terrae subsp. cibarius TaxID=626774 RepID=A0ABX6JP71_9GAMM|nr:hypothetical protein [Proteus terrae]QGW03524.1 hypothetical protein F9282_11210 [Proteus terrae subsp. cibarius]QIF89466.1 hypothetical protein GTH23_05190 [Proteus terrae subsp. cibarius]
MDYFFTLIKDNKEAVAFIIAVSGGIGFFLNYFLARKKIKEDKKSLRQQMITNNIAPMRQAWINDLKKSMATYISSTEHVIRYKENYKHDINDRDYLYFKENARKSDELYRYIELMLPEHDEIATTISSLLSKIQESLIEDNYSFEEIYNLLLDCSIETKKLLKKEWEVTKSLKEIE